MTKYKREQEENIQSIIKWATGKEDLFGYHAGESWGLDRFKIAYILATAEHESLFRPIEEVGGKTKQYAPYYGRGYVQLTHKTNYEKYATLLKKDLVEKPELALDHDIARFILVHGMVKGTFTGKKLSDYISEQKQDYVGARRIINSQDCAEAIAKKAMFWLDVLSGKKNIASNL